jgi:hypothetical protein
MVSSLPLTNEVAFRTQRTENLIGSRSRRRAERLRKEIALLGDMDFRLWLKSLACVSAYLALITLGVFAFCELLIGTKFLGYQWHILLFIGCAALTLIGYMLRRYPLTAAVIVLYLGIMVVLAGLFEDADGLPQVNLDLPSESPADDDDRKTRLRRRIQYAIAKRRMLLEKIG